MQKGKRNLKRSWLRSSPSHLCIQLIAGLSPMVYIKVDWENPKPVNGLFLIDLTRGNITPHQLKPKKLKWGISESQPAAFGIFNPAARVVGFDLTAARLPFKLVGANPGWILAPGCNVSTVSGTSVLSSACPLILPLASRLNPGTRIMASRGIPGHFSPVPRSCSWCILCLSSTHPPWG